MNKRKLMISIIIVIILVTSFLIGVFYGKAIQNNKIYKNILNDYNKLKGEESRKIISRTIYAKIIEVNMEKSEKGNPIVKVQGLPINKTDYNKIFSFEIEENIYIGLHISNLKKGDNIAITYFDEELGTKEPIFIDNVVYIEKTL